MDRYVNILGTEYKVSRQNKSQNPKLEDNVGLCEMYSKEIILDDFSEIREEKMAVENIAEYEKKVMRHEIVHAYLGESGLRSCSDYAENEELVDWIAIMLPKIINSLKKWKRKYARNTGRPKRKSSRSLMII